MSVIRVARIVRSRERRKDAGAVKTIRVVGIIRARDIKLVRVIIVIRIKVISQSAEVIKDIASLQKNSCGKY